MVFTDQELVEKTKRGDNAAFGALWERYERQVLALCRRYLASAHRDPAVDEHDLATDAFIRALHRLDRYEDRSAAGTGFETWLLEVAKRVCLEFLAKQRRRQRWSVALDKDAGLTERPDRAPTAEEVVQQREALCLAAQEINALPARYRLPFKLFLEEHPQKAIATALGISVESAAKRVQRARRMLQPRLAPVLSLTWGASVDAGQQRRARAKLRAVERALTEIVSDYRIVEITLPSGGEMQLCLRVDRRIADRAPEIDGRRAQLHSSPRAWKKRLELAELCYHSGRWEEARQEYREVLAVNPACFAAALRLGEMLQREEKTEEAAQVYQAALQQGPPPAMAAQLQARLLATQGNDEEAIEAFLRAIALAPREKANYYGLHAVLGKLSRYEEQLENLAKVRELDPEDLFALVWVYTPCARLERFDIARPLLERAVGLDPNNPAAVKHLFQARMNLGLRDAETLALAERLVRLAPQFVESWGELAWIYAELGRDEESLAVLQHFLDEHPNNAEAHAALAWRCHYLRRGEDEIAHARRAYTLEPHNWYICWTVLAAYNHPSVSITEAEALQYAEEIAARFPHDAAAMESLSVVYLAWRREAEALAYARRAVMLSPASENAHAQLAKVYLGFHRWEAAAEVCQRLVEMPGGQRWLQLWGAVLKALGDARADEVFAVALTRARAKGDPLECASVNEAWGKREEAIAAFRRCLSQSSLTASVRCAAEDGLRRLGASADEPAQGVTR